MLDDLNMRPNPDGAREPGARTSAESARKGDREVPIAVTSPLDAMHRWLDGEGGEAEARRDAESARYVEFWRGLEAAVASRRGESAPTDMVARVMSAIPGGPADSAPLATPMAMRDAPVDRIADVVRASAVGASAVGASAVGTSAAGGAELWWRRPLEVTPAAAIAMAAGLLAIGLAMGAVLRGG